MLLNYDFKELLKIFSECQVKYLVIGGYAVIKYTEPRFTKDLDIWVKADNENSQKVYDALKKFGAPLTNMTPADFADEGYFYQMGVAPVRIDVLMSVPGLSFDNSWNNRNNVNFDGIEVPFISKQDLIVNKRAAGRPQDLMDIESLLNSPD